MLFHIGLERPFRFERTLAVVVSLILAGIVVPVAVWLWARGGIAPATPRAWYFLYLACLVALGVACAPWPRVTMTVLSLATIEIGLGLGSLAVRKAGLAEFDLMPRNERALAERSWHPLLQAVMKPGLPERMADGQYQYNSLGLRGGERLPADLRSKRVIALFGGSTTEDISVPDGQTWAERLEELLDPQQFAVINHGSALFSTAQIVLQTAFYQDAFGVQPTCALYHVGGIDIQNAHIRGLDPGYADYQVPGLIDALEVRRIGDEHLTVSPVVRYLGRLAVLAFDTARPPASPEGLIEPGPDRALEEIYLRNVRTISAINRGRGVRTLWSGDVMDGATLAKAGRRANLWAPFVREGDLWPLLSRLNDLLRREAAALGDVYLDVDPHEFVPDDFADAEHFLPKGSLKFAIRIAPQVAAACR